MSRRNGINIELTPTQFDYLYEVIMMAYELEVPEQKGWDVQTVSYTHLTLPTNREV